MPRNDLVHVFFFGVFVVGSTVASVLNNIVAVDTRADVWTRDHGVTSGRRECVIGGFRHTLQDI